jgi:hypothetical protein
MANTVNAPRIKIDDGLFMPAELLGSRAKFSLPLPVTLNVKMMKISSFYAASAHLGTTHFSDVAGKRAGTRAGFFQIYAVSFSPEFGTALKKPESEDEEQFIFGGAKTCTSELLFYAS